MDTILMILYFLMTKIIIPKHILRALMSHVSDKTFYKSLNFLLEENHNLPPLVDEFKHPAFKPTGKPKTIDYLKLTPFGVEYVWRMYRKAFPWILQMPFPKEITILGGSFVNDKARNRYFKLVVGAMMADLVGCNETILSPKSCITISPSTIDPDSQNAKPDKQHLYMLSTLVSSAVRRYDEENTPTQLPLMYVDATTIKDSQVEQALRFNNDIPDVRRGRYVGMFGADNKSAVFYVINSTNDFSWDQKSVLQEKGMYNTFCSTHFHHNMLGSSYGICAVLSSADFLSAYNTPATGKQKTQGYTAINYYGDGYDYFFVIPISPIGVYELRDIMLCDLQEETSRVIESLCASDRFENADSQYRTFFPLLTDGRQLTAVCTHLDMRQLRLIDSFIQQNPDHFYTILCRDWMEEYLQAIWSSKSNVTVESIVMTLSIDSQRPEMDIERKARLAALNHNAPTSGR